MATTNNKGPQTMAQLVVIPCYNEENHIAYFLTQLLNVWKGRILLIDDGSTDKTSTLFSQYKDLDHISLNKNHGYGFALKTGFAFAINNGFTEIVTIDADGQHDPCYIPHAFELLSQADVVSGTRFAPKSRIDTDMPQLRFEANQFFTNLVNSFCDLELTDSLCGLKAYRSSILAFLRTEQKGYSMPLEIWPYLKRMNAVITELPINRCYPDPKRNFKDKYKSFSEILEDFVITFFNALQRNGLLQDEPDVDIEKYVRIALDSDNYPLLEEILRILW